MITNNNRCATEKKPTANHRPSFYSDVFKNPFTDGQGDQIETDFNEYTHWNGFTDHHVSAEQQQKHDLQNLRKCFHIFCLI